MPLESHAFVVSVRELTATDVLPLLSIKARFSGIEALLFGTIHCPMGRFSHVVLSTECRRSMCVLPSSDEIVKLVVVNPRPPFTVHFELKASTQGTQCTCTPLLTQGQMCNAVSRFEDALVRNEHAVRMLTFLCAMSTQFECSPSCAQ